MEVFFNFWAKAITTGFWNDYYLATFFLFGICNAESLEGELWPMLGGPLLSLLWEPGFINLLILLGDLIIFHRDYSPSYILNEPCLVAFNPLNCTLLVLWSLYNLPLIFLAAVIKSYIKAFFIFSWMSCFLASYSSLNFFWKLGILALQIYW